MAGYVGFSVVYVIATLLLFPSGLLTIAAGMAFGLWAILLIFLSALFAALVGFWIGRRIGREWFEQHARTKSRLANLERALSGKGWKVVALVRLALLVPFNLSNYLFGVTSISARAYVFGTALGIIPGTVLHVYLGYIGQRTFVGDQNPGPAEYAIAVIGFGASIILAIYLKRRMGRPSES